MGIRERLAAGWRRPAQERTQRACTACQQRYAEEARWQPVTPEGRLLGGGALDLPWSERRALLEACLGEWRTNPLAFRVVSLMTDFVVGKGITLRSELPEVQRFVEAFWDHPQNRMSLRLTQWSDELARTGELFVLLFRNPGDGMSYVRTVPALWIDEIRSAPNDSEWELAYHQVTTGMGPDGELWWPSPWASERGDEEPVMLHFAVNRPAGAQRGMPDLAPILRWLRRYQEWAEDRARLNRHRASFLWHCQVTNPSLGELERKRALYARTPTPGTILVTDANERWEALAPTIQADDAEADGKALRLMVAAGAGVPLHFLGEGESATRATAAEMGQPTYRHYRQRQMLFGELLYAVAGQAARRALPGLPDDLCWRVELEDLTREDNETLARAAGQIVEALTRMKAEGWIEDERAAALALHFAGQ